MQNLANIRKDYRKATLDVASVDLDPVVQFEKWFGEALNSEVMEPNAMNLSTVNEQGKPSARMVLLKGLEKSRFVFYTNYHSKKGKELDNNPACALTFFWPELERQVRVEGIASRVESQLSDEYFQSRPRESQMGAWASPQSILIESREILEERFHAIEKKFEGQPVLPRPHQWGGFQVEPFQIEFWQGGPGRMHDRIQYVKVDAAWKIYRLAP
ncbi:MAG TPA: pyridoxamine 5'-phosphate oxidase [Cyclobacteriaceae bacterium]|nr:pyridoxamine 5'-phosphate oxidase [Cyclobacteriaceae bacterium]